MLCLEKNGSLVQLFKMLLSIIVPLQTFWRSLKVFICFFSAQFLTEACCAVSGYPEKVTKWRSKEQMLKPQRTVYSHLTAPECHTFRKQRKPSKSCVSWTEYSLADHLLYDKFSAFENMLLLKCYRVKVFYLCYTSDRDAQYNRMVSVSTNIREWWCRG